MIRDLNYAFIPDCINFMGILSFWTEKQKERKNALNKDAVEVP